MPDMRKNEAPEAVSMTFDTPYPSIFDGCTKDKMITVGPFKPFYDPQGKPLDPGKCHFVCLEELDFQRFGQVKGAQVDAILRESVENKALDWCHFWCHFGFESGTFLADEWSEPEKDEENSEFLTIKNAENA